MILLWMCNLASLISIENSHFDGSVLKRQFSKGCQLLTPIVKIFESLIQLGSVIICAVLCTFWQSFRCKEDPALMKLGVNFSLQKCKMRHEKVFGEQAPCIADRWQWRSCMCDEMIILWTICLLALLPSLSVHPAPHFTSAPDFWISKMQYT